MAQSYNDLLHFFILFVIIVFLFAYLGHTLLGGKIYGYSTMFKSAQSLLKFAFGETEFTDIFAADPIFGPIFYWAFQFIVTIMLMNVLLAIVVEGFMQVSENTHEHAESIFSTIYVVFKRCRTRTRGSAMTDSVAALEDQVDGGQVSFSTLKLRVKLSNR